MTNHTGQESNGRIRISASLLLQAAAYLVAFMLLYAAMDSRIAVIETRQQTKQDETDRRLNSIENKIDQLLSRVSR